MRKRFQKGSVKKSSNGRYWIGQWREDGPDDKRRERTTVLGKTSKMTKSEAREKIAAILQPINSRATQAANVNLTVKESKRLYPDDGGKPDRSSTTARVCADPLNYLLMR